MPMTHDQFMRSLEKRHADWIKARDVRNKQLAELVADAQVNTYVNYAHRVLVAEAKISLIEEILSYATAGPGHLIRFMLDTLTYAPRDTLGGRENDSVRVVDDARREIFQQVWNDLRNTESVFNQTS